MIKMRHLKNAVILNVVLRDEIGKRGIGDFFVSNNCFHNIPRFFDIILK